jgi:two-component system sensor histidine kinase DegS
MSDEHTALEKLVAEATLILRETEHNLQQLAQIALSSHEQLRSEQGDNGRAANLDETTRRLQQIGQQLSKFSEHSRTLQLYLQNGLESPPIYPDDEPDAHWPRTRVLQSQEEERTQLARNLENGVGQLLANAVFELASCRHLLANDQQAVSEGLDALQYELEQGLADIRQVITDLEPSAILNNFGLGGGIRRYLEQYETRTKIASHLLINTNLGRLPSLVEMAIFRVIQEALRNVYRHAQASQVEVVIEEKNNHVEFSIIDNGVGFASDRIDISKKNLGLARMVDYAALLQGKLKIFSEPGHGTHVILAVPYQAL